MRSIVYEDSRRNISGAWRLFSCYSKCCWKYSFTNGLRRSHWRQLQCSAPPLNQFWATAFQSGRECEGLLTAILCFARAAEVYPSRLRQSGTSTECACVFWPFEVGSNAMECELSLHCVREPRVWLCLLLIVCSKDTIHFLTQVEGFQRFLCACLYDQGNWKHCLGMEHIDTFEAKWLATIFSTIPRVILDLEYQSPRRFVNLHYLCCLVPWVATRTTKYEHTYVGYTNCPSLSKSSPRLWTPTVNPKIANHWIMVNQLLQVHTFNISTTSTTRTKKMI